MADNIKIDSHKLIYHPCAVADWLRGENIYPVELEISPSGACNHRCTFCAFDYVEYKPNILDKDIILNNLRNIAPKGLKSVIYAGEGEPLIHNEIVEIVTKTKEMEIDVAMSSNGVLLTKEISNKLLKSLTWIRFSVAAVTEETYKKIHRGKDGDLEKVFQNLLDAVKVKKEQALNTTLGVQMLMIDDNQHEVIMLANKMKEIGVDYFSVKPYSQHPQSKNTMNVNYTDLVSMENELMCLEDENFKTFFRANSMKKLNYEKGYKKCHGLPFMSYIDSLGNVWPCLVYIGREGYSYGNLYKNSFVEIWESKERKDTIEKYNQLDIEKDCRELCRLDEINRFLDDLKNPSGHVNFI